MEVQPLGQGQDESHEFRVAITWLGGHEGNVTFDSKPSLSISSASIWGGKAGYYSPQELFVASVTACYLTTFGEFIKRMKQPLESFKVDGYGVVKRDPAGGWQFSDIYITMHIIISIDASPSKVHQAVELTEKYCMITRSVVCQVHVDPIISQSK